MEVTLDWEQAFDQEIESAKKARQRGNEAMARVCARRAANAIVQAYLHAIGIQPYRNAMQNFRWLQNHLSTEHPAQEVLTHLLLKVNLDFSFPDHIDLIQDALALRDILSRENKASPHV